MPGTQIDSGENSNLDNSQFSS